MSHAAAALPMRRSRLVFSAVVVGAIAPDLEYFVRLTPGGGWGHTLLGALCMSLPLGLVVLWFFHSFARPAIVALLPVTMERRLGPWVQPFRYRGRVLLIVASVLAGIATHLAWDSFTHDNTWLYQHCSFLRNHIHVTLAGSMPCYFLLQLLSSVGGILVLVVWIGHWYRVTPPGPQPLSRTFTPSQKLLIAAAMLTLSSAGGVLRAFLHYGVPRSRSMMSDFAGDVAVAMGTLLWWQLVAWGALLRARASRLAASTESIPN